MCGVGDVGPSLQASTWPPLSGSRVTPTSLWPLISCWRRRVRQRRGGPCCGQWHWSWRKGARTVQATTRSPSCCSGCMQSSVRDGHTWGGVHRVHAGLYCARAPTEPTTWLLHARPPPPPHPTPPLPHPTPPHPSPPLPTPSPLFVCRCV